MKPTVAVDGQGRFLTAWTANAGNRVWARAYDNDGPDGARFQVGGVGNQSPALASDNLDNVIAAWTSPRPAAGNAVEVLAFDDGGKPRGSVRRVDDAPRFLERSVAVASNALGRGVAVWESVTDDQRSLIRGRRLSTGASPVGRVFNIRGGADRLLTPDVAMDATGRFTVVWLESQNQTLAVRARRYRPDATPIGDIISISDASVLERSPRAAMSPSGEMVVVWTRSPQGGSPELVASWYEAHGQAVRETVLETELSEMTVSPADVTIDRFGNTIVAWTASRGRAEIHAQVFDTAGDTSSPAFFVGPGHSPSVAVNAAGTAVIMWENQNRIWGQRVQLSCD